MIRVITILALGVGLGVNAQSIVSDQNQRAAQEVVRPEPAQATQNQTEPPEHGLAPKADVAPDADQINGKMDLTQLNMLIQRIDSQARQPRAGIWQFELGDHELAVFTDTNADRMRIVLPITDADKLSPELHLRLLQANYDSALDARYAIAQGMVWSVFVHPLADLSRAQFLSAVGQVVNTADSFGSSYSSGVFVFGGGDSGQLQRELLEKLLELETEDSI